MLSISMMSSAEGTGPLRVKIHHKDEDFAVQLNHCKIMELSCKTFSK